MGAAQSIPSEVEAVRFSTTHPPRNKLTKPRTNSNAASREASCLPPSLSRLSLSGGSRPLPIPHRDTERAGIISVEYSKTLPTNDVRKSGMWSFVGDHDFEAYPDCVVDSALPGVVSVMPVSTGTRRRGSMVTRSSTNSSAACASLPNRNSEIPLMGTVKRRSQLLAAPPATATRRPMQLYVQGQCIPDTPPPDSQTFVLPQDSLTLAPPSADGNYDRCMTPSGYSVLGAFKRGSLRIANGAASPAPSSSRASPEMSMRTEYFNPSIALPDELTGRPESRGKGLFVITNSTLPTHEVRLVPPSPTYRGNDDETGMPSSPFSFARSHSVHSEDMEDVEDIEDSPFEFEPPANDTPDSLRQTPFRPTESYESLSSTTSSAISIGYEYHKILTEQCLSRTFDKPVRVDVKMSKMFASAPFAGRDAQNHTFSITDRKENDKRTRRPSINEVGSESMDSGYSSSGSVNSWKTARSHQHVQPNSNARKPEILKTSKNDTAVLSDDASMKPERSVSRRRSVVAAIRRRYSQGDLKAFARSNTSVKQSPLPTIPTIERSRSLWKPRPELKHRRSMITVVKSSIPQIKVSETLPNIQHVPPLSQHLKMERKGAFNPLTIEDYLPLVQQLPLPPTNYHNAGVADLIPAPSTNIHDSVLSISIGPELCRGSRITGQEYYQRFSKQ